ncbi:Hypothetical protein Cul05146_1836 [Corynebacterium ulcerans]|nr:Hypothetical protein Cul05146_1836 [Corynebacterium ulcerans]
MPVLRHTVLFSAYAEVVPSNVIAAEACPTFLRVCGGSSIPDSESGVLYPFSPRMRR